MYSKTKCNSISYFVAVCAKIVGVICFCIRSLIPCSYKKSCDNPHTCAEKVFKKPESDAFRFENMPTKNKNVDISVVIPTYNAEKYIKACVDSVLNQKTKYNIQIIVVNDNSTDNTKQILNQYNGKTNIKLIDYTEGGSAAKSRNKGLTYGEGRYITFLDADDLLDENAIENMVKTADEKNADIVQGGWQYIYDDNSLGNTQNYLNMSYDDSIYKFDLPGMPWGKIYRRELFENVRFPSNYTAFKDTIIHFLIFRKAKKICSLSEKVYFWRKNIQGITSSSQNTPKALQSYYVMEEMLLEDRRLGLKHDDDFLFCSILQLTNFCYANVRSADEQLQKIAFELCCELYDKELSTYSTKNLPYVAKAGEKALKKHRFDLWILQGRLFELMR